MVEMILAGDVGATKTLLEVGVIRDGRWCPAYGKRYVAAEHRDFCSVLRTFRDLWMAQRSADESISCACFGAAGPALDNRVQMTNLDWLVDGHAIATGFGIPRAHVVNDFAAAAHGIEMLDASDLVAVQPGVPVPSTPRVVIGAGTGLGVAYLIPAPGGYKVIAGEAGHAGFAPSTPDELELWRDLYQRAAPVPVERVISGPGLVRIYRFIERRARADAAPAAPAHTTLSAAAIAHAALVTGDPLCSRALDMFISCYGAAAADHALAVMARGGVYIAGGIAPKILPRLLDGGFIAAFNARGPQSYALHTIPVSVVTNERLGVLGAASIAAWGPRP